MTPRAHLSRRLPVPSRLLAGALAAIIVALGLFTAAPAAHEQLHADAHKGDHACAVELFAQGITPATSPALVAAGVRPVAAAPLPPQFQPYPAPAGLRPPGRAPPAA